MKRRDFFKKIVVKFCYGVSLAFFGIAAAKFITFRKARSRQVVFDKNEAGKLWHYKGGVFLAEDGDNLKALSARCTHLGCLVNMNPLTSRFECPCHGSVYDINGKRLSGPTKRDMEGLQAERRADGSIVVIVDDRL